MLSKNTQDALPAKTLSLIVGSTVIIGIIIFAGLLPKYMKILKIKKQIIDKQIILENQKAFLPVFTLAQDLSKFEISFLLPFAEKAPIFRDEISGITSIFETIAVNNNMTLSGSGIGTGALNKENDFISVELTLAGKLSDFRQYLIHLAELPFFKTVEQIMIHTKNGSSKKFSVKIHILVGLKNKR